MSTLLKTGRDIFKLARQYPLSLWRGIRQQRQFRQVNTYCMFIGYPRSGHSLIGFLLDAHPNITISHELGALKYIHAGFKRTQLFQLIRENSQAITAAGCKPGAYAYAVPHQWQGKAESLKVIGDKQGQGAALRLQARPWLLDRLRHTLGLPLKIIHVVRNPYDNISTISRKTGIHGKPLSLAESIDHYFSLCDTIATTKRRIDPDDLFEFQQETFIKDPPQVIKTLCGFLGVETSEDYLNDCTGIVYKSPHQSRHTIDWDPDSIAIVKQRLEQYPFLQGYRYEDAS